MIIKDEKMKEDKGEEEEEEEEGRKGQAIS